jgi:uncharacterized membrane protein YccC
MMKSIIKILNKNNLTFAILYLICGFAPILLKLLFSGAIGPTFNFYFLVLWVPVVGLTFSLLRGWKEVSLTGVLIISAFLISIIGHPSIPAMDFRRQFAYQLGGWMVAAVVVSLVLQIVCFRSPNHQIQNH